MDKNQLKALFKTKPLADTRFKGLGIEQTTIFKGFTMERTTMVLKEVRRNTL